MVIATAEYLTALRMRRRRLQAKGAGGYSRRSSPASMRPDAQPSHVPGLPGRWVEGQLMADSGTLAGCQPPLAAGGGGG